MSDKLVYNCTTGQMEVITFTQTEIDQREADRIAQEIEDAKILPPTDAERIASLEEMINMLMFM